MSCEIIPVLFTSPTLDNKIVQELRVELQDGLSWLQICFGTARPGYRLQQNGNISRQPEVYVNDGTNEYVSVAPGARTSAYCFFTLDAPVPVNVDDADEQRYQLSLIFWFDMSKVDTGRGYDYSRDLAKDVLRVLTSSDAYSGRILNPSVNFDPSEIFARFNLGEEYTKFLSYPYGAFSIDMEVLGYEGLECDPFEVIGGGNCSGTQRTPCELLLDSLSENEKNTCILPAYDFSDPAVLAALTTTQRNALIAALCTGGGNVTIFDQDGNVIDTVPCGGSYTVLVFSGIQDEGPPYNNSIVDEP